MIDYTSVLKTTHNCLLDYTYATFNVNRSDVLVISVVNGNFKLIFWTLTNPIWLLMINLPNSP